MNRWVKLVLAACILTASCQVTPREGIPEGSAEESYSADLAVSWNEQVLIAAVAEDGLLTLKGVRTAAMLHIAMHDALNSVQPRFQRYAYRGPITDADPLVAAAQAAYVVAMDQYPGEQDRWEHELNRWTGSVEAGPARSAGIALGNASAAEILRLRKGDGWSTEAEYTWHPMSPGVYAEFKEHSNTPDGFVFGAGWARATPFMLPAQGYFRSPPPPQIDSDDYSRAFNEVKEVGRFRSAARTEDQTHLAMWWKDFVENSHNRLARDLMIREQVNLWNAARTFALLNMNVYDAYVNVFDNKFFFNHWRPYTAIRWAANDGNPATEPDSQWNNLHRHTYAFPSYPSAHGTASAAAMVALADLFGDDYTFTMTTAEVDSAGPFSAKMIMNPPTRTFSSFSSAALECSMSRVYLGIHFRYDSIEGYALGTKIGRYGCENFLRPALQ